VAFVTGRLENLLARVVVLLVKLLCLDFELNGVVAPCSLLSRTIEDAGELPGVLTKVPWLLVMDLCSENMVDMESRRLCVRVKFICSRAKSIPFICASMSCHLLCKSA
jgi:hypothetical protein